MKKRSCFYELYFELLSKSNFVYVYIRLTHFFKGIFIDSIVISYNLNICKKKKNTF